MPYGKPDTVGLFKQPLMHCQVIQWIRSYQGSRVLFAFAFVTHLGGASLSRGRRFHCLEGGTTSDPLPCNPGVNTISSSRFWTLDTMFYQILGHTLRSQSYHLSILIRINSGSRCMTKSRNLPSSEQQAWERSVDCN